MKEVSEMFIIRFIKQRIEDEKEFNDTLERFRRNGWFVSSV